MFYSRVTAEVGAGEISTMFPRNTFRKCEYSGQKKSKIHIDVLYEVPTVQNAQVFTFTREEHCTIQ